MTLEVEINGRLREVVIEGLGAAGPAGGRFRVRVDDEVFEISARPTDLGLSIVFEADGRSIDAAVTPLEAGTSFVQFPDVAVTAVVDGRRRQRVASGDAGGTGVQRITAPMPGRVVRVLVKPGDEVKARQGVVVVEAMKMENELTATRPGVVKEISVAEGASVEAGRLLVLVE